ncbi:MAG: hypothetical protein KAI66_20270 [Lentisphaeria bacterium]|nr:hypothetical protein [Lentisphaeria bacterium]
MCASRCLRLCAASPPRCEEGLTPGVNLTAKPDRTVPIEDGEKLKKYSASDFEGVTLMLGAIRIVGELVE